MTRAFAAALALVLLTEPAFPQDTEDADRLALGRELFLQRAQPGCPICHTLAEAGATGTVGPSLDGLRPSYERVLLAITDGVGPMPPYEDLSEDERDALAFYVSTVAGGS